MSAHSVSQETRRPLGRSRSSGPVLGMLVLYTLVGLVLPVVHAQLESDRHTTTHIEAQNAPCEAHDELSCPICRVTTPAVPLASGFTPVAVGLCSIPTPFPQVTSFVRKTSSAPLGARAPPAPSAALS